MSPRPLLLALQLSACAALAAALAPAAREARIVELLGKGRVGLPQSDEVELDDLVDESRVAGHDDRPSNVTDRKKPRSSVRKTHRGERPFDERTYHLVLLVPMQVT